MDLKGIERSLTVAPDNLVKSIHLSIPDKIKTGNVYTVDTKFVPSNAPDTTKASWTTDNNRILKVNNDGTFKALSAGVATITVTTERASESIEVAVLPSIEKITLSTNKMNMLIGEKKVVGVTLSPKRYSVKLKEKHFVSVLLKKYSLTIRWGCIPYYRHNFSSLLVLAYEFYYVLHFLHMPS